MQKMKADNNISEDILLDNIAYDFEAWLTKLRQCGWLVDTIRIHLNVSEWPNDDSAEPQRIVPNTGSKRKMMYEQTNLDERGQHRVVESGCYSHLFGWRTRKWCQGIRLRYLSNYDTLL